MITRLLSTEIAETQIILSDMKHVQHEMSVLHAIPVLGAWTRERTITQMSQIMVLVSKEDELLINIGNIQQ